MKKCWGQPGVTRRWPGWSTALGVGVPVCWAQGSCPGRAGPRQGPQRSSLLSPLRDVSGNVLQLHEDFYVLHPGWEWAGRAVLCCCTSQVFRCSVLFSSGAKPKPSSDCTDSVKEPSCSSRPVLSSHMSPRFAH